MPGMQWPFVLAPLPPRKRKRITPGFTDEELLYLEEVLAVIDSMSESDVAHDADAPAGAADPQPHSALSHQHAPDLAATRRPSRSQSTSSLASSSAVSLFVSSSTTSRLVWQALRGRATEIKFWTLTHPSTLGIFLVFLATLLLSSATHSAAGLVSIPSLLGAVCLGVGLKILAASEDQTLHLDPAPDTHRYDHHGDVTRERGRTRTRGRRSRRHTTTGQ